MIENDVSDSLGYGVHRRHDKVISAKHGRVLKIEENVSLGPYNELFVSHVISVGHGRTTGAYVYMADNEHGISRDNLDIRFNTMKEKSVSIACGCWIGPGAYILVGSHIGDFSVLGANTLARRCNPDASAIVGSLGRVVKNR